METIVNGSKKDYLSEINKVAEEKYSRLNVVFGKRVDCGNPKDVVGFECIDEHNGTLKGRCETQCKYCFTNE